MAHRTRVQCKHPAVQGVGCAARTRNAFGVAAGIYQQQMLKLLPPSRGKVGMGGYDSVCVDWKS
jgi:hypothetical protein